MTEQRIPQGGLRKPRSNIAPRYISPRLMVSRHEERLKDGRILCWSTCIGRGGAYEQIGARHIYVTNDYGELVLVERGEERWF